MKLKELTTKHHQITETLKAIQAKESSGPKHCQHCPGNCQGLSKEVLSKGLTMLDSEQGEEEINDPGFSGTDYCSELQAQLKELSHRHLLYQTGLKNLIGDLSQVESQGEGYDDE